MHTMNNIRCLVTLRFLAIVGFALAAGLAQAQVIDGKVVGVIDGDTLDVLVDGRAVRIRLHAVNTPEKGEPFSQKAKQSLSDLAYRRHATVRLNGQTTHNRLVGIVTVDGLDVNLEQVRRGLAWYCSNYLDNPAYLSAEAAARSAAVGIHSTAALVRPGWCVQAQGRDT